MIAIQNFNVKFQFFCALRTHVKNFVNFQLKKAKFHSNSTKFTPNDPLFLEVHTKKGQFFFIPHPVTPFFLRNPTPNAPCSHSRVGTYPSLSYLSAPWALTPSDACALHTHPHTQHLLHLHCNQLHTHNALLCQFYNETGLQS